MELSKEWIRLNYQIISLNYSYVVAAYAQDAIRNNKDFSSNPEFILFQHGSLYNFEKEKFNTADSIVLGIDELQKVEKSHSFLYKSTQNIHDIKEFIHIVKEKNLYIVYGCSMGPSDAFYFKQLFSKNLHNKTILIYGYGKKTLDSLKENIIEYTGGLNNYKAETNNEIIFSDCSKRRSLSNTKDVIDQVINFSKIQER